MAQDMPPIERPTTQARENQLRFVVNVLAKHAWLLLISSVIGSLLMGVYGIYRQETFKPAYQAEAKVIVAESFWDRGVLKDVGGTPLLPVDAASLVKRTSRQQIAERVARAMVQRDIERGGQFAEVVTEDEYANKTAEILNCLNISVEDPQSGVIVLQATNLPDQDLAARIAEFAARVFVDQNRQLRLEEERKTHEVVLERLKELQQELHKAESAEWDFKKQTGFQASTNVGDELSGLYKDLTENGALKEETAAHLAEVEEKLQANNAHLPEALGNVTDSVVSEMLGELSELLREQLSMSVVYKPEYPGLQEIQADIDEKKEAILEAVRRLDEGAGGGENVWQQRQDLYRQKLELRLQLTGYEIRMAALQRMLDELLPQIPELANRSLQFERLQNETTQLREQFDRLREREFGIRTALGRDSGRVERQESVMASALPMPDVRVMRGMNFIIGGAVGLVLAFAFSVMIEIMDTSIQSIEDIATYTGLEVIGTIPMMQFGKRRRGGRRKSTHVPTTDEDQIDACIVTQHDPKSPVSEAYRTLRTNFQFATIKRPVRTLMVTSAVPGEGKTTTAVNLAVTMADCGMRVLVVDTDLRRPNVHRVLRMERGPGLADVLRGEASLPSVIRKTRVENLWIISSGRVPPNPSELMGSERMAKLMAQLGADFDLVVCDAPSVLVVTDPVLLATHVDTTIIVVAVNRARRETVQRAHRLLQTASAEIAGVVLNGLEASRRHYYYYYYYYEDGRSQRRRFHL